ncbi:MAG: Xaa-Pro peptidase family protein [Actinomycetota bacterium]|nr:Xaa-Pro peptidase family protein [Actinomycetota bacterium]
MSNPERLERLRASLEEPLLVTDQVNVKYLTGFNSDNVALLVEPGRTRLFTDFRYAEGARGAVGEDVEVVETERNVYAGVAQQLSGDVGFEAAVVSYANYETLRSGSAELVPRTGVVEALRAVKDDAELAAIRKAAEVSDDAYERLSRERFIGRTEKELAWRMEQVLHECGGEKLSFDVAVGSGPNGAFPHADPTDREVKAGELVVVDSGTTVEGYASDCTRTFATGSLAGELKEAYAVCLEAQQAALDGVRAGVRGADVDAIARVRIDASPFKGLFGHGLGHGVGMRIHEGPTLRPESKDVLQPGNVVTVEPGIYMPGKGGIRIEDLVVVTDGDAEVLTHFSKDLFSVE